MAIPTARAGPIDEMKLEPELPIDSTCLENSICDPAWIRVHWAMRPEYAVQGSATVKCGDEDNLVVVC